MIQYLWELAPVAPLVALYTARQWQLRQRKENNERSPVTDGNMLRPAGYHLSLKLEQLQERLSLQMLIAILPPVLLCLNRPSAHLIVTLVLGTMSAVGTVLVWRTVLHMRNVSAGWRGEQCIAEKLNELLARGYFVFHDFDTKACGNIDHIVVGPAGVFAIETKYRRKKRSRNEQREHEVIVNEDSLRWPAFTDHQSISQALRNAEWLARFLSRSATESIPVEAVIALPGWLVTRRTPDHAVAVLSGKELAGFFGRQPVRLTDAQVDVIRAKLDDLRSTSPQNIVADSPQTHRQSHAHCAHDAHAGHHLPSSPPW
jgi:hypothetical protein